MTENEIEISKPVLLTWMLNGQCLAGMCSRCCEYTFYINIYLSNRRCVDILPSALLLILTTMARKKETKNTSVIITYATSSMKTDNKPPAAHNSATIRRPW